MTSQMDLDDICQGVTGHAFIAQHLRIDVPVGSGISAEEYPGKGEIKRRPAHLPWCHSVFTPGLLLPARSFLERVIHFTYPIDFPLNSDASSMRSHEQNLLILLRRP
jgi:hypothetical protein